TSKTRSQALPNLPTTTELGYPDVTGDNWQGLVVPAGTPKQIIAFLHGEIVKIVALPDIRERLAVLGFEPVASTPEEFAEHVQVEWRKWAKVIKTSNINAEGGRSAVDVPLSPFGEIAGRSRADEYSGRCRLLARTRSADTHHQCRVTEVKRTLCKHTDSGVLGGWETQGWRDSCPPR